MKANKVEILTNTEVSTIKLNQDKEKRILPTRLKLLILKSIQVRLSLLQDVLAVSG